MADQKTTEPEIIAQHREQLAYLLTEAAEIEHGLLCCYLFAAYSLKRGEADGLSGDEAAAVVRWRGAIVGIAVEEMLHLSLVSNLLSAIGFAPQLERPNFPVAPGYHPSGVVVSLAPFDLATLDHFVFLERPEGIELPDGAGFEAPPHVERATRRDRLVPSSEDYATVGHLYRGIRDAFSSLSSQLGEKQLFVGNLRAQVGPDLVTLPGLTAVTDLASAHRAIDIIVEQGEGTATGSERSHYRRFLAVRDEYRALLKARPDFLPAHPVARNPVMRKPPTPHGKVHVEEPNAARVMDLGNALYGLTLRMLGRAFGQGEDPSDARRVLVGASIDLMTLMSPVAELLGRMPAGPANAGVNAGLSFTMSRSHLGMQQCGVWPVLIERTRDLAAGFASAAKDLDPLMGATAASLSAIASQLERVSPVTLRAAADAQASADGPPVTRTDERALIAAKPVPVDVPPAAASSAPAIEEAPGKKMLLRFEGRRCIHSRNCVLGAPNVFLANVKGAWLKPDAVSVETLVAVAHACPSGAITYQRIDGGPEETAPPVNVARIRENGPLALHADIQLDGRGAMFRATLCRCGASKNKPFCDSSHLGLPFAASGEPAPQPGEALTVRNGPLAVTPTLNGPLDIAGNLEICSGTGRTVARVQRARLCRCGGSSKKPFCDGTHARIGFRSE